MVNAGTFEFTDLSEVLTESPKCQSSHENPDEPKCGVIATHSFSCTAEGSQTVLICTPNAEYITWHMAMRDAKCSVCEVPVWECWVVRPL